MKTLAFCSVFSIALLLTAPAFGQDNAAPVPPAAPAAPIAPPVPQMPPDASVGATPADSFLNSPLFKAYVAAMKDLKPYLLNRSGNVKDRILGLDHFAFSPETKAVLRDAFGNDDPLHIVLAPQENGGMIVTASSDALDYKDQKTGASAHFEKLVGESVFNRDFNKAKFNIAMPGFVLDVPGQLHAEAGNISFAGDSVLGPYNFWLGKSGGKLDRLTVSAGNQAMKVVLDGLAVDAEITTHKNMFNIVYDYRIDSIDWGSDKVTNINTNIGLTNIDAKSMADLVDFSQGIDPSGSDQRAQAEAGVKMLKRFAFAVAKHGGAIEIHDVSAQYHGMSAGFNGRISLPNLKEADLDSPQKVYEKLLLRITLRVPMPMVEDIAHRAARAIMESQSKQSGAEVTDVAVDLVARGMIDKMTEALVKKQKWAHFEKDNLVSVFEIKHGKLYLDGHVVSSKSNPFMAMAQGK